MMCSARFPLQQRLYLRSAGTEEGSQVCQEPNHVTPPRRSIHKMDPPPCLYSSGTSDVFCLSPRAFDRVNGMAIRRAARLLPLLRSATKSKITRRGLLTQSRSEGPSHPPLLEQTVGQHFASIVSRFGDRTAFVGSSIVCRSCH